MKILDALAFLLVREHEIAAVMEMHYSGHNKQVVASVVNRIDSERALAAPKSGDKAWFSWFTTMNPRRDTPKFPPTKGDSMKLVDPDLQISPTLKNLTDKDTCDDLLITFLQTEW
jgi:hypothetical protein